jgi:hypothetical protein
LKAEENNKAISIRIDGSLLFLVYQFARGWLKIKLLFFGGINQ